MRVGVPWQLPVGLVIVAAAGVGLHAARIVPPPAAVAPAQAGGDTKVVPFKINVPEAVLADLKQRLKNARLPDEIDGAGWSYGTNLAYLKELIVYWRDKFDWREQERRLNGFEQFKTNIDGLDIH